MTKPIKHYAVAVLIFTQTQPRKTLLLHHRKFNKWMPPGGHQESWENPLEAAIRETREETSLDITSYIGRLIPIDHAGLLPLPDYMLESRIAAHGDEPGHYHIDIGYVVHMPEQPLNHNQAESHGIGWFTQDQLKDLPLFENVCHILDLEFAK